MSTLDELEISEKIGQLKDKANNYLAFLNLPVPIEMHLDCLKTGMQELEERLKTLYIELGGDSTIWD